MYTVFTCLRIALAEAPHRPDTHHADAQSTHCDIDMRLLLSHDKEADCHYTKSSRYQPVPIRFPFNHLCERVMKLLLKTQAPVAQWGKILCCSVSMLEGEGGGSPVVVPLCWLLQPADSLTSSGIKLQVCVCLYLMGHLASSCYGQKRDEEIEQSELSWAEWVFMLSLDMMLNRSTFLFSFQGSLLFK